MRGRIGFVLGVGVGYLVSTRSGRRQLNKGVDQVKGWASDAWRDPRVQGYVEELETQAADFAKQQTSALKDAAADKVRSTFGGSSSGGPTTGDPAGGTSTVAGDAEEIIIDADDAGPGTPGGR